MTDTIIKYPDPRLRLVAEPVGEITDELRKRALGLFPLLYADGGIGLAAPQVGWSVRLFAMNVTANKKNKDQEMLLVNPEIVEKGGGVWLFEEGCLSVPGVTGKVLREREVTLRGYDLLKDELIEIKADGLVGRCILHEFDHLEGILFIDHLSRAKLASLSL